MRHRHFGLISVAAGLLVVCATVLVPGVTNVASAGLPDIPAPAGTSVLLQRSPAAAGGTGRHADQVRGRRGPEPRRRHPVLVMYTSKGPKNKLVP